MTAGLGLRPCRWRGCGGMRSDLDLVSWRWWQASQGREYNDQQLATVPRWCRGCQALC